MIRNIEVREYKFEGGTTLTVQLDRRDGTLSFIDPNSENYPSGRVMRPGEFSPNNFVFNRRELKYMNGWINLLHAMEYVINDCKKTMNRWQDERAEAFTSLMIKLDQFEHKEEINNEPDKKDAGKGPARIQRSVRSRKK